MRVEVESAAAGARWGSGGLSLWQEAEQEGGCEAVGLQESGLRPRAQPVPIAVQQHQGHTTGPDKTPPGERYFRPLSTLSGSDKQPAQRSVVKPEVLIHPEQFSLIYSRHPFIVPGGRFVEFYYWPGTAGENEGLAW
ncbi:unnamed protein product [Rangifer tarandus platyrhynchus]|uniref:Uncharacterized protein n=2 Tax=Rangifer tarandus platyrhynchus TaxID=3082113 RepID=A0AC59Y4Y7_RANTA|nr:unnamed protein product [Rangifer tarandus platyrhynchus]